MITQNLEDIELLRFESLATHDHLVHAVTTGPWNMACHCGPCATEAPARRRRLCEHLGLSFNRLTLAEQVHQNGLAIVDDAVAGAGRGARHTAVPGVDGLLTDRPDTGLMLLSADCPLVLLFDPRTPAVGVAHASWRCTVARIGARLVQRMTEAFGSQPTELMAGIGPSAGPERYVVGQDVRRAASSLPGHERFFRRVAGGMTFDLWAANREQLIEAGLRPGRIELARLCTIDDERFFSYRRQGPETGRFALVAGLRNA
ncbi:MAG: laccase domain-containing protein [Phycisphaerae bacterium]|nr:laccase domain-containing protein [Phycisphaerae bacterium]